MGILKLFKKKKAGVGKVQTAIVKDENSTQIDEKKTDCCLEGEEPTNSDVDTDVTTPSSSSLSTVEFRDKSMKNSSNLKAIEISFDTASSENLDSYLMELMVDEDGRVNGENENIICASREVDDTVNINEKESKIAASHEKVYICDNNDEDDEDGSIQSEYDGTSLSSMGNECIDEMSFEASFEPLFPFMTCKFGEGTNHCHYGSALGDEVSSVASSSVASCTKEDTQTSAQFFEFKSMGASNATSVGDIVRSPTAKTVKIKNSESIVQKLAQERNNPSKGANRVFSFLDNVCTTR